MIPSSPAIQEARAFMKKHERDPAHVQHVTLWAAFLFRELQTLHQLSSTDGELLIIASLLHDTGWSSATEEKPHHKESARLIREHSWNNLTQKQSALVALLARYHRKSPPSPLHQRYQNLPKERKQALQHLAGILRVADALDRSHRQNLHPSKLELRPGVCLIRSKGTDPEDAIFGLERKGDLFQQAFSLQPFLKLVS